MGNLGLNFARLNFDEKAEGAYFKSLQNYEMFDLGKLKRNKPGIVHL